MLTNIPVSIVQHAPYGIDRRTENVDYIVRRLDEESHKKSLLVAFPEMGITSFFRHESGGYERYWNEAAIELSAPEITRICEAARSTNVYAVVGFAERGEKVGLIYNSAALIGPEGIVGVARKVHLPGLEKLYYTPSTDINIIDSPIGKIGIVICYDAMFPEYIRALSDQGAEILVFCSSVWRGGRAGGGVGIQGTKRDFWSALPLVTAIQNQAFVVSCNGCGSLYMGEQAGTWHRLGLSQIVSPTGEILGSTGDAESDTIRANLSCQDLVTARAAYQFSVDRRLGERVGRVMQKY